MSETPKETNEVITDGACVRCGEAFDDAWECRCLRERRAMLEALPKDLQPCLLCGAVGEPAYNGTQRNHPLEYENQPYKATVFYTSGHYGSTFFDSFTGCQLVLTVCDECLRKNEDRLHYIASVGPGHKWKKVTKEEAE